MHHSIIRIIIPEKFLKLLEQYTNAYYRTQKKSKKGVSKKTAEHWQFPNSLSAADNLHVPIAENLGFYYNNKVFLSIACHRCWLQKTYY